MNQLCGLQNSIKMGAMYMSNDTTDCIIISMLIMLLLEAMAQLLFGGMVTCFLKRKYIHTDEEVGHACYN